MRAIETRSLSAKELFKNRMHELPAAVREALKRQEWKVSDHEYYAFVKTNGAGDIKVFTKSLNEGVETNIHQGVVPNDDYFLLTSIVVNTATSAVVGSTVADAVAENYNTIHPILKNAKFNFKVGQDVYFEKCGAGIFQTNSTRLEPGEYKLENPKFLYSKQELAMEFEQLGAALPAETWVKVRLKGLKTSKK